MVILIGNSFPLGLVKRRVVITPETPVALRARVFSEGVASFWGHAQTLARASELCGVDLTPTQERPALTLSQDGLPCLAAHESRECWVVAPEYSPGYRPAVGEAVPDHRIVGWQILKLMWED